MDFVWQYVYGPSAWRKIGLFNELEYSIRSVKKYGPEGRYFVVGDKPDISHEDVIHIPGPPRVVGHPSKQKQHIDKLRKMTEMANNPLIGDEFVLMYDDIFLLKPTTAEDLKINWARAEVNIIDEYLKSPIRMGDASYKKIWRATYEYIWMIRYSDGKKTYDWETHTPRYLEKEKLKDLLGRFDFETNPKIVTALYDGFHETNTQIINSDIQADLWTHKPGMDFGPEFEKQYMNIYDDVIVPEFIGKMEEKFGA